MRGDGRRIWRSRPSALAGRPSTSAKLKYSRGEYGCSRGRPYYSFLHRLSGSLGPSSSAYPHVYWADPPDFADAPQAYEPPPAVSNNVTSQIRDRGYGGGYPLPSSPV